ncbi:hypothetical protein HMPREF1153_1851 [Selenomonas sp. CM52]|nr:hypothetical protein HMPREF1153_1851 [Selenomonas sp. CM52]
MIVIPWKGNRYIHTVFDTITYCSKRLKPHSTSGLGLFFVL